MFRITTISALCLWVLSGCATTQNLVNKIGGADTPLQQVLNQRPDLLNELATVELRQFFNRVENPTIGQVKVTQTGLLDDSIQSKRTIYNFKLNDEKWTLVDQKNEWRCARGKNTKDFVTKPCP